MSARKAWNPRRQVLLGLLALTILIFGLGGWSAFANIASAIVSSGMIEVEGNRKVVQHPDGGVVGEINVQDGDYVDAGEVLIRFDDTLLRSELAIIEGQLYEMVARRGRLDAERDGQDTIAFDEELVTLAAARPDIAELIDGQERLFAARRESRTKEAEQLAERKVQISNQIVGAEAQLSALREQLDLIGEELADQQSLLDRGLSQASRVLALQREQAALNGSVGELIASIAESRGRITEIEIEILKLETQTREEAISTLRDLQFREVELREKRLSTLETLSRLEVRAPVAGVVYDMQVYALRAVVRPADPVMYIIPQDQPLVISSRIPSIHIDQVRVGQEATLRFSAFDQRTTPEIRGQVTKVSADVFTDENTGANFYRAEILPLEGEVTKLGDLQMVPGMPVEAFIKTGDRTPFNYLVKPLTTYFNKAFRET